MSDNKRKAVLYYYPYKRLIPVLEQLPQYLDALIVTDFDPAEYNLPGDRFIHNSAIVNQQEIQGEVDAEFNKRMPETINFLNEQLQELPLSKHFQQDDYGLISSRVQDLLNDVLQHRVLFKKLRERLDIQCVVCALSSLDRNRAVLSAAKLSNIPTVHINHGSFPQPEYRFPEFADYSLVADELCANILDTTRVTDAQFIATGLPFAAPVSKFEPGSMEMEETKRKARAQLEIPSDHQVVVYLTSWVETFYIASIAHSHTLVDSLEFAMQALKARNERGQPTTLLVRQHPSIIENEDEQSIKSLAYDLDFHQLQMANGHRDTILASADVAIVDDQGSSVVVDCFAQGCPVIALQTLPNIYNELGESPLRTYISTANDVSGLQQALDRLMDDRPFAQDQAKRAIEFIRSLRTNSPEHAIENICSLIQKVSGGKSVIG